MQFVDESIRLNKYREQHAKALAKVEAEAGEQDRPLSLMMANGYLRHWEEHVEKQQKAVLEARSMTDVDEMVLLWMGTWNQLALDLSEVRKAHLGLMLDILDKEIEEANRPRKAAQAAAEAAAAAAAAALEREAGVERAIARTEQRVKYMQDGRAYLLTAKEAADPVRKLEAAEAAIACFVEYKKPWKVRAEVDVLIANAPEVADAAQKELDKPRLVRLFELVCELLVTG